MREQVGIGYMGTCSSHPVDRTTVVDAEQARTFGMPIELFSCHPQIEGGGSSTHIYSKLSDAIALVDSERLKGVSVVMMVLGGKPLHEPSWSTAPYTTLVHGVGAAVLPINTIHLVLEHFREVQRSILSQADTALEAPSQWVRFP